MATWKKLDDRIVLIDAYDLGKPGRTSAYLILEENITLIETSASPSVPVLLEALKELQISPTDLSYIIVTHIHLDHAGGAGLLLEHCPNAKVVVHPKGARHLADPSRLIAGAKAVYGDDFDRLFSPIIPVPNERLIIMENEAKLQVGSNVTLTFYDTPGHANHHFSIYDPVSNGIFAGDTAGIFYQELLPEIELYIPSTSPNQFSPEATLSSISLYESLQVDNIYFSHFGMSKNCQEVYRQMRKWIPAYVDVAKNALIENSENRIDAVTKALHNLITEHLTGQGLPTDHPASEILMLDMRVSAMGLIDYLSKQTK